MCHVDTSHSYLHANFQLPILSFDLAPAIRFWRIACQNDFFKILFFSKKKCDLDPQFFKTGWPGQGQMKRWEAETLHASSYDLCLHGSSKKTINTFQFMVDMYGQNATWTVYPIIHYYPHFPASEQSASHHMIIIQSRHQKRVVRQKVKSPPRKTPIVAKCS